MENKRMIDMHPLDDLGFDLEIRSLFDFKGMSEDEQRYVAEHKAAAITEHSSATSCAKALGYLTYVHIPQINKQIQDKNAGHHYSNPIQLIREESKKRDNKKIWLTGNVKAAHERIKTLNNQILPEETPKQMMKIIFWCLLFGLLFLGLAIFSTKSGAAVDAVTWMINTTWFKVVFILGTLGLSLYYGFFSMGILVIGGVFLLAWIILENPGLTSFIVNGALFLIAAILLFVVAFYIYSIVTYKPLTEEELRRNKEYFAERDILKKELAEYSETMISKLNIMKNKFIDNEKEFMSEIKTFWGPQTENGMPYMVFSFLNKYYRKVKW